jgi:hypothetical protein
MKRFVLFLIYLPFVMFLGGRGLWKLFHAADKKPLHGIKIWLEGKTIS